MSDFRYWTSKIKSIQELGNVSQFGYRGEALASIRDMCSILNIESRAQGVTQSYLCSFKRGAKSETAESSITRPSSGTTVTVYDLFDGLPVRKKCQNDCLEIERIRHRMEALALMHPTISFSVRNDTNGSKILHTQKTNSSYSVFAKLYGSQKAKPLCEVSGQTDHHKVSGYIGKEGHYNSNLQFIFVNKHLVLKSKLHKLLNYYLMKSTIVKKQGQSPSGLNVDGSPPRNTDRHGMYIINVDCPLTEYDITFDPTKTLVEFKDWKLLTRCFEQMVLSFLVKENLLLRTYIASCKESSESAKIIPASPPSIDTESKDNKENETSIYGLTITAADIANARKSSTVRRPRLANLTGIKMCSSSDETDKETNECIEVEDDSPVPGAVLNKASQEDDDLNMLDEDGIAVEKINDCSSEDSLKRDVMNASYPLKSTAGSEQYEGASRTMSTFSMGKYSLRSPSTPPRSETGYQAMQGKGLRAPLISLQTDSDSSVCGINVQESKQLKRNSRSKRIGSLSKVCTKKKQTDSFTSVIPQSTQEVNKPLCSLYQAREKVDMMKNKDSPLLLGLKKLRAQLKNEKRVTKSTNDYSHVFGKAPLVETGTQIVQEMRNIRNGDNTPKDSAELTELLESNENDTVCSDKIDCALSKFCSEEMSGKSDREFKELQNIEMKAFDAESYSKKKNAAVLNVLNNPAVDLCEESNTRPLGDMKCTVDMQHVNEQHTTENSALAHKKRHLVDILDMAPVKVAKNNFNDLVPQSELLNSDTIVINGESCGDSAENQSENDFLTSYSFVQTPTKVLSSGNPSGYSLTRETCQPSVQFPIKLKIASVEEPSLWEKRKTFDTEQRKDLSNLKENVAKDSYLPIFDQDKDKEDCNESHNTSGMLNVTTTSDIFRPCYSAKATRETCSSFRDDSSIFWPQINEFLVDSTKLPFSAYQDPNSESSSFRSMDECQYNELLSKSLKIVHTIDLNDNNETSPVEDGKIMSPVYILSEESETDLLSRISHTNLPDTPPKVTVFTTCVNDSHVTKTLVSTSDSVGFPVTATPSQGFGLHAADVEVSTQEFTAQEETQQRVCYVY